MPDKERCETAERKNKDNLLDHEGFNEKIRPLGTINLQRRTFKSLQKHLPMKY